MDRRLAAFVVFAAVLLSPLGFPGIAGAPMHPTATSVGAVAPPCVPSNNSSGMLLEWNTTPGHVSNTAPVGPAPYNVTFWLTVNGTPGNYNFTLRDGDGSWTNLSLVIASGSPSVTTSFRHDYLLAAYYSLNYTTTGTSACAPPPVSSGNVLHVYGSGGPNPVSLSAPFSVYVGTTIVLRANVTGQPAGTTTSWSAAWYPSGFASSINSSFLFPLPTNPTTVYAQFQVVYPNGLVFFAGGPAPINVLPDYTVNMTQSPNPPTLGSPSTVWFNATAVHVPGANVFPISSYNWSVSPGNSLMAYTGTLSGPSVNLTFYVNQSGPTFFNASISVVVENWSSGGGIAPPTAYVLSDPDTAYFTIVNTTRPAVPPILNLSVDRSSEKILNGTCGTNCVWYLQLNESVVGGPYTVWPPTGFNVNVSITPTCSACPGGWNTTQTIYGNYSVALPVQLLAYQNYTVLATLEAPGSITPLANVSFALLWAQNSVTGSTGNGNGNGNGNTGGSGIALSLVLSPSNGSAPLNVTATINVTGGRSPYNVTWCLQNLSQSVGTCQVASSRLGWGGGPFPVNFTAITGNYTFTAVATDSNGSSANATSALTVGPAGARPLLHAQASYVAPSGGTGGAYEFVTDVFGGVAPYQIQWTFGDGSSASALPGSTITHTYVASGTYEATLTVRDSIGQTAVSRLGPIDVVVPTAAGASGGGFLSAFDAVLVAAAAVVILAAAVTLGLVARWASRRREAVNWFRTLEKEQSPPGEPRRER